MNNNIYSIKTSKSNNCIVTSKCSSLFKSRNWWRKYLEYFFVLWRIRQFIPCLSKGTSSSTKGSKSSLFSIMNLTTSIRCFRWCSIVPINWSPKARKRQLLQEEELLVKLDLLLKGSEKIELENKGRDRYYTSHSI